MLDWKGINEFLSVSETESFTLASQRLGISTAQVSRQISALESRLAVQLFYRTTRKVSLTEGGRQLYDQYRPLITALAEAQKSVSAQQNTLRGRIRLTAPVNFGEQIVAPAVIEFCAQHADVEIDLVLSNQRLDLIQESLDLAIRIGPLPSSSLKARRLASRTLTLCASPAYLKKNGTPTNLKELSGQSHQRNCLAGTSNIWHFCQSDTTEKGQPYSLKIQGKLRCNSGVALVDAACRGLGLVQLPDHYLTEAIAKGELIPLLEHCQPRPEDIWAVYPSNRHVGKVVRGFIEMLEEALKMPAT